MTEKRTVAPDLVETSLAVIADGQDDSGAFLAGPTFSQYGYCWFRDSAFIAEALDKVGHTHRSARFHGWVARVLLAEAPALERARTVARAGRVPGPEDYLHCRYDAAGKPSHDESWPAFQLDGPGIWLWSLAHHLLHGGHLTGEMREAVSIAARYLGDLWRTPCSDAWEEHEDQVHTSTLAAIRVGVEAAVSMAPELEVEPAIATLRTEIVGAMAVTEGAFTKWVGNAEVDASLLWMAAPYESMPPTKEPFAATLTRIASELTRDGLGVHRYRSDTYYGGGAWPVLTSAFARVLLRRAGPGDLEHAVAALRWIEAQADARGHLPEQVADHALAPERIDEWRELWGESARPLLWSHAAYLALRAELAERVDLDGSSA